MSPLYYSRRPFSDEKSARFNVYEPLTDALYERVGIVCCGDTTEAFATTTGENEGRKLIDKGIVDSDCVPVALTLKDSDTRILPVLLLHSLSSPVVPCLLLVKCLVVEYVAKNHKAEHSNEATGDLAYANSVHVTLTSCRPS
jgi:hypothetical protein